MGVMLVNFFFRGSTLILVSPNPSLASRPTLIPWSGLIYIHCDNGLKVRGLRETSDCNFLFYFVSLNKVTKTF